LVAGGQWEQVVYWSEQWIALGEVPEPAFRALMVAHANAGDMAKVAAAYDRCVEALREELCVEPSEQTRALFTDLRSGKGLPTPTESPTQIPSQDFNGSERIHSTRQQRTNITLH